MSNNNHGHIGQPPQNPSWNPLQIPSYIPRQPQLAHMSNERPMVRSPLAWHAPAPPPESLYNFMSANHKNLEHQMNPLLPSYVRGPPPFDSMDLSLQSSRNSNSPLNKSGHAAALPQHEYGGHKPSQTQQQAPQQQHHQQQQQTHNILPQQQQPGSYPIHNLSTNSSPSAIPQQQQQQQQQSQQQGQNSHVPQSAPHLQPNVNTSCPSSPATKYMNANGNDCDTMLPPPPSTTPAGSSAAGNGTPNAAGVRCSPTRPGGNNNVSGAGGGGGGAGGSGGGSGGPSPVHYMRNYENELQAKSMQKPVELVNKECGAPASGGYSPIMGSKMASLHGQVSPKKHPSPMRSSYHGHHQSQAQQQQQQHQQSQQQQHMSPYNNPAQTQGGKHNGPHTPPTPASPVHPLHSQHQQQTQQHQKHATAGGKLGPTQQSHLQGLQAMHAASMDYNQMHLQHANNAYAAQQQQQQQMQQQQQYHFQQQQQHQQQQHHHQQQQQQMMQQQQQQHYHQQQQHQQANQHQQQHHHQPPPPQHSQHLQHASPLQQSAPLPSTPTLTNLDSLMKHRHEAAPAAETSNTATTTTAASAPSAKDKAAAVADLTAMLPAYKPPPAAPGMPYGGEEGASTDLAATAAGSNNEDESLDSTNSNSNSSRMRRKRKSTKVVRMTPAAGGEAAEAMPPKEADQKRSPPKTHDSFSPLSPVSLVQPTNAAKADGEGKSPAATLENGHAPANGEPNDAGGGKSLERIRDMFSKVMATPEATHDSNSNGRKTPPEPEQAGAAATTGSPKTKKQRQALKLRNISELHNSNSNCSSSSLNDGGGGSGPVGPAHSNDNAVSFAGELHKTSTAERRLEDDQSQPGAATLAAAAPLVRPLSPQSNSRSSSSSSSSSSCSNTTRSSTGLKEAAPQNGKRDQSPAIEAPAQKGAREGGPGKEAQQEGPAAPNPHGDTEEEDGPLNLDRKAKGEKDSANCPGESARFEEVENKLEEMFAGIEDEHSPHEYSAGHTPSKVNLALELSSSQPEPSEEKPASATVAPLQVRVDGPPPTKAAKKSTLPSPPLTTGSPSRPRQSPSAAKGAVSPSKRVLPPRNRSNSTQMEAAAPPTSPPPDTGKPCLPPAMPHDDEQPSTSAAAAQMAAAALLEAHTQAASVADDVDGADGAAAKATTTAKVKAARGGPKGTRQPKGSGRGGRRGPGGRGGGKFAKRAKHAGRAKAPQKRRHNSSDEEREASGAAAGAGTASAPLAEPKYKSPFVLVKKDGSVTVINTPSSEEVGGEKQTKGKKPAGGYGLEHKKIRGLHSSTLSTKYDADTTDSSWICVFCKRGPHKMGLGDLFGPYVVSNECEEYRLAVRTPHCVDVDEAFVSKRRRSDMVQTNARNLPVVPARMHQSPTTPGSNRAKKKKKSLDDVPPELLPASDASQTDGELAEPHFSGMCRISESNYEVWMHEDCIIWAPDVFLIGASVMDLDAAVWNSTRQQCGLCDKPGAIVCCLQRDCKQAAHVPCARDAHWSLNEDELKVHCAKHWPALAPPSSSSPGVAVAEICQPAFVTSSYS